MEAATENRSRQSLSLRKRCAFAVVPLLALLLLAELAARCGVSEAVVAKRFEQIEQIIVFLGNEPGQSIFEPDVGCVARQVYPRKYPERSGATRARECARAR